jgi:hypothetical protein
MRKIGGKGQLDLLGVMVQTPHECHASTIDLVLSLQSGKF